jgi:AcrR family transcriptional regulator
MPSKRESAASRLDDARARMYRDLIFDSAEFVFGRKGFEGATMQEIAAEAGVSLKTVYASFPGKQNIYLEIMAVRGRAMSEAVRRAREDAEGPIEQLSQGARAFVRFALEHADWMRIHTRSRTSWAERPETGGVAELWDEGMSADAALLREGMELGLFWQEEPQELALVLQALEKVQVSQAIESGESDVEAVADRLVERLLRLVCKNPNQIEVREAG